MQCDEPAKTVIFVSARRPVPAIEQQMETLGVKVSWASSIYVAAGLLNSNERPVVITELALVDGNWRDLVERVRRLGNYVPIVLLTPTSTAELWWDALDCDIEDILVTPLSASRLCQFLATHFKMPN